MSSKRILPLCCLLLACSAVGGDEPEKRAVPLAPWHDALLSGTQPVAFSDHCFTPFETTKSLPQDSDLQAWFEIIAGQPQGIYRTRSRLGTCGAIDGIVQLKMPWADGRALRFALDNYNRLQIHLFRGEQGVTLVYHEDQLQSWVGYVTRRAQGATTPRQWFLAATDDGRNRRTVPKNHDHYELCSANGEVILSRGDIELLRVPMPESPREVYFQGKSDWYGLSAVSSAGPPLPPAVAAPPLRVSLHPGEWNSQLDESVVLEANAEALSLTSPGRTQRRSWVCAPLPRDSVRELILEVGHATPGSGIYLGNGKGPPRYVLRYVRDARSGQLCVLARNDDDVLTHDFRGLLESPLPVVDSHHWLRLVFGAGQVRWWVSPDGVHWAQPSEPIRNVTQELTHFGLHVVNRPEAARITLNRVSARLLEGLALLAEPSLSTTARAEREATNLSAWTRAVAEPPSSDGVTPDAVTLDAWRRACALRTLAAGCNRELGNELLFQLIDSQRFQQLPLRQQLPVLADIALLLDVWDDNASLQRLARHYHRCGMVAFEREAQPAYSSIRPALMTIPVASRHLLEIASEELLRAEILQLVYGRQFGRLREFSRELRWFQLPTKAPLLDWAESLALRQGPAADGTSPVTRLREEWREPLVEDLSREVYNILAQLRVELSMPGREDAARTVALLPSEIAPGVAPHGRDPQLLVSLYTAVRSAVQADQALRERLRTDYGDLADLRIRQAMQRGDEDAVRMAVEQFDGSAAAVAGQLWLGDRELTRGFADLAAWHYERASRAAPPSDQLQIVAKRQLARAFLANDSSDNLPAQDIPGTTHIGPTQLPGDTFRQMLQELSERAAANPGAAPFEAIRDAGLAEVPSPGEFTVHRRARLDGPVGNDPNREFVRDVSRRQLDWVARQCRVAIRQDQLFLGNRFQVAAYDLVSKQRIWQSPPPPGQIQFAQEATFTACQPVVTDQRVYSRLLYTQGASIACFDRVTGQMEWTVAAQPNEELISDPFFLRGGLVCLALERAEQQENTLRLLWLDERTGYVRDRADLIRLRESWRTRRYCGVTRCTAGAVIALGGLTIKLDDKGRPLWLRKQTITPAGEEPQWITQHFQPPMISGGRVYLQQPGVRTLDCLDLETGELVWSRLVLDAERLIQISGPLLIYQDQRGFTAVAADTGRDRWRHTAEGVVMGAAAGSRGDLVYCHKLLPTDGQPVAPRLAWLDPRTGEPRGQAELPELAGSDPRLGPLVVHNDHLWTLWGNGQTEATRDVVELIK